MARCFLIVLLVLAFSHAATSRNVPTDDVSVSASSAAAAAAAPLADQKNLFPCIPKQPMGNDQLFVLHATAPLAAGSADLAESPSSGSMGLKDNKNFIYGGIGGFAGMGGYAGFVGGGIPVLGGAAGLGKYGGIGGGAAGMGAGLGGLGGLPGVGATTTPGGGGASGIGLPTCP